MLRTLSVSPQSWPLSTPFRISRGVKTAADVVAVTIDQGPHRGRGESVPYARYGETVDTVIEEIQTLARDVDAGLSRADLAQRLGPGAARNAIDCALWDLEARLAGRAVADTLGQPPLRPLVSALTVSLDTPQAMGEAAARMTGATLIKVKVDDRDPAACLAAVRASAPAARLIVDPNESWTLDFLIALQPTLAELKVALIEQPLPAGEDAGLAGITSCAPICADESCHVAADLPGLKDRYQVVNIKLDKTGGLTEALDLLRQARAMEFGVMVGCMVSSSMSIAPAFHVARHADFVDLDGPTWLANDYTGGVVQRGAQLVPPQGLWGEPDGGQA